MVGPTSYDPLLLVLHYLQERDLTETARTLERESGIFFNTNHFEELILSGMLEEADEYLNGFTSLEDNELSARIFISLKQQKLIEALHNGCKRYARIIYEDEIRNLDQYDRQICERANELLAIEDLSTHPMTKNYSEESARRMVANQAMNLIRENPVFRGKLERPNLQTLQYMFNNGNLDPNGIVFSFIPNRSRNGRNGSTDN